jgi:hypothetical protein
LGSIVNNGNKERKQAVLKPLVFGVRYLYVIVPFLAISPSVQ